MSSLIRQSHANNDLPLWVATEGDSNIDGNLTVQGFIDVKGNIVGRQDIITNDTFFIKDVVGNNEGLLTTSTPGAGGNMIIQSPVIKFGAFGAANGNTSITTSAQGANLDSLVCGGQISATGTIGSRGMALFNAKYLSCYDSTAPTNIEAMRIGSATTGTPGLTFSQIAVQPGSAFYLSAIGVNSSTLFMPNYPANDLFQVDGKITAQELALNSESCGTGTISVGLTNVVIPSTRVTATSKIFLSFYGSPSAGPGNGPSNGNLIVNQGLIVPGTSFRVDHTDTNGVSTAVAGVDVTFHWMIIN